MANLEKKNIPPLVVAICNLFFACIGYVLIGQTGKVVPMLIAWVVGVLLCGLPSFIVAFLAILDGFQVATAVANGESVDENEYKVELLYKIAKVVHKDAVFNG